MDGVATGAEVNVNADWDADSGDAEILNKPTIPTVPGNATQSDDGLMSSEDKTKLDGVEASAKDDQSAAEVAVDTTSFGGNLGGTDSSVQAALDTLDDLSIAGEDNVQANWDESDSSDDAYIQNKPTIPTVPDLSLIHISEPTRPY